jgi:hypothetical protein
MKIHVELKQRAETPDDELSAMYPRTGRGAVLSIDGTLFGTTTPASEAEAIEINTAAERLVEELMGR